LLVDELWETTGMNAEEAEDGVYCFVVLFLGLFNHTSSTT
jgi:hypothetical protein